MHVLSLLTQVQQHLPQLYSGPSQAYPGAQLGLERKNSKKAATMEKPQLECTMSRLGLITH